MAARQFMILNVERLKDMVRVTVKDGTINFIPDEVPADLTNNTARSYKLIEDYTDTGGPDPKWIYSYRFER